MISMGRMCTRIDGGRDGVDRNLAIRRQMQC